MDRNKKIWAGFNLLRTFPVLLAYLRSPKRGLIDLDIAAWTGLMKLDALGNTWMRLNWLMVFYPEYRNLFYNRIRSDSFLTAALLHIVYRPMRDLYITTVNIGGGLFIQHGFSTIISPKRIGDNCWINQQVTIGYAKTADDSPVIGNNVKISAGAIVIGDITVGDNCTIGANAVVTKNVPPNCTVVGNPGYIVMKDNKKVKICL